MLQDAHPLACHRQPLIGSLAMHKHPVHLTKVARPDAGSCADIQDITSPFVLGTHAHAIVKCDDKQIVGEI